MGTGSNTAATSVKKAIVIEEDRRIPIPALAKSFIPAQPKAERVVVIMREGEGGNIGAANDAYHRNHANNNKQISNNTISSSSSSGRSLQQFQQHQQQQQQQQQRFM